jgi:hypothetical protein
MLVNKAAQSAFLPIEDTKNSISCGLGIEACAGNRVRNSGTLLSCTAGCIARGNSAAAWRDDWFRRCLVSLRDSFQDDWFGGKVR